MIKLFHWLTDKIVLRPSTEPIDVCSHDRHVFSVGETDKAQVEVWKLDCVKAFTDEQLLVVKFPGTAGRAEAARPHPFDVIKSVSGEVWALNHRGYGGSDGPASLQNFTDTIDALWHEIDRLHPNKKILVYGNSLGCISALYMSMRFPVHGLILKNGFCLKQLIRSRPKYFIWNFGLARLFAAFIPRELNGLANASRSEAPCVLIRSEKDTVIPPAYQIALYNSYAGPKQEFVIKGADHHEPVGESQAKDYSESVKWLVRQMGFANIE